MGKLLSLLIAFSCVGGTLYAKELPKLLLCIYVEGMQLDLVKSYSSAFISQGKGLEKILRESLVYSKVKWEYIPSSLSSSLATITSGTFPYNHSIGLGVDLKKLLTSEDTQGVFTTERLSAQSLDYQTFTDILGEVTSAKSALFAVAPFAEDAIVTGGRSASAVFWLDERSAQWCSNAYYPRASQILYNWKRTDPAILTPSEINSKDIIWSPLGKKYDTVSLPYHPISQAKTFKHKLKGRERVALFKQSPLANDAVVAFSQELLRVIQKEKSSYPAVVQTILKCTPQGEDGVYSPYSREAIDAYVRVDRAVASLSEEAIRLFGRENVAFCVVAVPSSSPFVDRRLRSRDYALRQSKTERIKALINLYLSALYGKESWVERIEEPFIYLNHSLLERKGCSLVEVRHRIASLMRDMSEVRKAYPLGFSNPYEDEPLQHRLKKSLSPSCKADLFFLSRDNIGESSCKGVYSSSRTNWIGFAPLYSFCALSIPSLEGRVISRPISIASLAASFAYLFRIRPPSDTEDFPLDELLNSKE